MEVANSKLLTMKKLIVLTSLVVLSSTSINAQNTVHAACEASMVGYTETRNPTNYFAYADLRSASAQAATGADHLDRVARRNTGLRQRHHGLFHESGVKREAFGKTKNGVRSARSARQRSVDNAHVWDPLLREL